MNYIGIAYTGNDNDLLKRFVDDHMQWLSGDRKPYLYGSHFIVLYDSNTTREFIKKLANDSSGNIVVYHMEKLLKISPSDL